MPFQNNNQEEEVIRVKMPRGKEVIGVIEELLGASRFKIRCKDGNLRICRMPGKFRKRMKISVGDLAIVDPWSIESDSKGDVVWVYTRTQASWLRKNNVVEF